MLCCIGNTALSGEGKRGQPVVREPGGQLLIKRLDALVFSCGCFPLTPALSPGEREKRKPALDKPERDDCKPVLDKPGNGRVLFPPPGGEGQGEGQSPNEFRQTAYPSEWASRSKTEMLTESLGFPAAGRYGCMSADMKTFAQLGFLGRLIAVEGLDGSGKSTQIYLLKRWLEVQ